MEELNELIEKCRREKQMMEAAFDHAYEGIIITDRHGIILMLNEPYAKFLQVKREEVIGRHVTEVVENTRMHIVGASGQAELAQVQRIRNGDMLVHRIPIKEKEEVVAVVGKVLFQDVNQLHTLSQRVRQLDEELAYYKKEFYKQLGVRYRLQDIIGSSPKLAEVKKITQKVAASDTTVFIYGESGTGKEMFAHALHHLSYRVSRPFVKVNCAAIPETLLEAILFGYEEGSFTGALPGGKKGKFAMAHGGTIFLDEIAELPITMQAKLLRVLQEKEIEPVGSVAPVPIDVRVIAASNRHLWDLVKEGRFREDLYYRLNVLTLTIPPLRERKEDIPQLVEFFLQELSQELGVYVKGVTPQTMQCLLGYDWPGNVRELRNVLERSLHLTERMEIDLEHLPFHMRQGQGREIPDLSLARALEQAEREAFARALKAANYKRDLAIELLGISRSSFYQKCRKYGLLQQE